MMDLDTQNNPSIFHYLSFFIIQIVFIRFSCNYNGDILSLDVLVHVFVGSGVSNIIDEVVEVFV